MASNWKRAPSEELISNFVKNYEKNSYSGSSGKANLPADAVSVGISAKHAYLGHLAGKKGADSAWSLHSQTPQVADSLASSEARAFMPLRFMIMQSSHDFHIGLSISLRCKTPATTTLETLKLRASRSDLQGATHHRTICLHR